MMIETLVVGVEAPSKQPEWFRNVATIPKFSENYFMLPLRTLKVSVNPKCYMDALTSEEHLCSFYKDTMKTGELMRVS